MRITTVLACCCISAIAQNEHAGGTKIPSFHPGDVIKVAVTLEGPDADRVSQIVISGGVSNTRPNQSGFTTEIFPGESKQIAPRKFEVSYKVPPTQAEGDYYFRGLRAVIQMGIGQPVQIAYSAPADFPEFTVRIENSEHVEKPKIKDVRVLSNP